MENKTNKKDNGTRSIFIFVTMILVIVLIFLIAKTGLESRESIGLALAFAFLIIMGLVKIFKFQSNQKSQEMNQSESSSHEGTRVSDNGLKPTSNNTTIESSVSNSSSSSLNHQGTGNAGSSFFQKIKDWLSKFPKPKQVMIVAGSFIIVIVIIIITITSFTGEADTTITGTWSHELGSVQYESTWVVNVTMWEVDSNNDSGYLYMVVSDDGTFTLTYEDVMVSYGTWEVHNSGYVFVFSDPDSILGNVSDYYDLKGSKLYMSVNAYWIKDGPDA